MKNNFNIWTSYGRIHLTEQEYKDYREEFVERYEAEPTEEQLGSFIENELRNNLDDELSNIDYHERKHGTKHYVIVGSLYRWYNHNLMAGKVVETMESVIRACSSGQEDIEVFFKNGVLRINGYNHDSDCSGDYFRIRELTEKGYQYYIDHKYDMTNPELAQRLFNDSHYSHRVTIFNEIYGI